MYALNYCSLGKQLSCRNKHSSPNTENIFILNIIMLKKFKYINHELQSDYS